MTSYLLFLALSVGIYSLFSLGLNLQWGYTGLLNFGHGAFMLVGAYTTVLLNLQGIPSALAALGGMGMGALLGLLMGMTTLRLRRDYLGIVTIGLAESLRVMAINEDWLTQGTQGLVGFDRPFQSLDFNPNLALRLGMIALLTLLSLWAYRHLWYWLRSHGSKQGSGHSRTLIFILGGLLGLLGLGVYWASAYSLFYYTWVPSYRRSGLWLLLLLVLALTHAFLNRLLRSPWGRIIQGIREDPDLVTALGKPVLLYRLQALMLGGAIAALAGSFYVWNLASVFPDQFKPQLTFDAWTIVILGGAGHPLAPILGSTLFWAYETLSRFILPDGWGDARLEALRLLLIGGVVLGLMRWRPEGLLGNREHLSLDR